MTTATGQRESSRRRHAPPYPPINPRLCYPWRRLTDWGFGARGIAALQKAGLPVLRFGKQKFFRGAGLISILENGSLPTNHKEKPGKDGTPAGQKGKSQ